MAGLKEKISTTIDKLTHHGHTEPNTTGTTGTTGTTTGTGIGNTSTTGTTGSGYDNVSSTSTGAGYGTSSATGTGLGQTSGTGATGTGGYSTTGVTGGATATGATGTGEIIDQETFTKTEDHEVLIEKKKYELEHRPVQKQYVVETKFVGEQAVPGGPTEVVGNETREVDERIKQAPAGDRTVVVENVDVPAGARTTGTTGTGTTGNY
jgi:hypothetical protein